VRDAKNQKHHSIIFQRAWNKYGRDAFMFEVLLYCDPEHCIMYEQLSMDHYQPKYNICKIAGSSLGVKRSEECKRKISESKKGNKNSLGIKPSEDTKRKISSSLKGRFGKEKHPMWGKSHSEESRRKIAIAKTGLKGESAGNSKLTIKQVREIRQMINDGMRRIDIASKFGVSPVTIGDIKSGKSWNGVI